VGADYHAHAAHAHAAHATHATHAHAAHIGSSGGFFSGFSTTSASVVKTIAMEPAFCNAERTTLAGNDPSRNQVFKFAGSSVVAGVEICSRTFSTMIEPSTPALSAICRRELQAIAPQYQLNFFVVQAVLISLIFLGRWCQPPPAFFCFSVEEAGSAL